MSWTSWEFVPCTSTTLSGLLLQAARASTRARQVSFFMCFPRNNRCWNYSPEVRSWPVPIGHSGTAAAVPTVTQVQTEQHRQHRDGQQHEDAARFLAQALIVLDLAAEPPAAETPDAGPEQRAQQVGRQEIAQAHAGDAGDDAVQLAQHLEEAREAHEPGAVAREAGLHAFHLG